MYIMGGGFSADYKPKMCITRGSKCVWASSIQNVSEHHPFKMCLGIIHSKCLWASSIQSVSGHHPSSFSKEVNETRREEEEACNTFVPPAITSMCTYNVLGS
jgi:hypothetical protein